jgi:hypothetical protein
MSWSVSRPADRYDQADHADVAELVDAHGSGPCAGNGVKVQVLSSASRSATGLERRFLKPWANQTARRRRGTRLFVVSLAGAALVFAGGVASSSAYDGSSALPPLSAAQRATLAGVFATMPQMGRTVRASRSAGEIGAPRAAAAASRYYPGRRVLAASLERLRSSTVLNGVYWVVALSSADVTHSGPAPIPGATTAPASRARETTPYRFAIVDAVTSRVVVGLAGRR